MKRLNKKISYVVSTTAEGGQIRITTEDNEAILAVHEFLKFQIQDHRTGDYCFDCAFTSVLKRAIRTLWIVLDQLDLMWIPVKKSWRLNERLEPLARYYLGDSSVAAQAQQAPEHLVKADSGL